MSKLEIVALSGELTSSTRIKLKEPSNNSIDQEDVRDYDSKLSTMEDFDSLLKLNSNTNQVNQSSIGSQTMSRGWSGNTGPKGVLLDFKASHGKSGAILGGDGPPTSCAIYSRQTIGSKSPMITHCRPSSSPSSDSGCSDQSERGQQASTIDNPLYGSTKTTTRLTLNIPNPNHLRQNSNASHPKVDPTGRKSFGHLREVGVENFIQAIEAEKDDNQTVVLVHLYDPALESCVVLNNHLSNLARAYPRTKFLRALASEVDFFSGNNGKEEKEAGTQKGRNFTIPSVMDSSTLWKNRVMNLMDDEPFGDEDSTKSEDEGGSRRATDTDVLPTLIWYRSGQYVQSLSALEGQMPHSAIVRGGQGCKDLEILLKRNGIIT